MARRLNKWYATSNFNYTNLLQSLLFTVIDMTIFYLAYGQATTQSTAELLLTDDRFNCEYYYFYPMARVKQNSDRSLQQTSNNTIG